MRKFLNVITLIVMLGVNIMNPFAYVSSSDVFEEIQNLDEIVQEDYDFEDEENNDEILDEEENDENYIDEEDETDEDSELDEDDNIEEEIDENDGENTDDEEENNEAGDEDYTDLNQDEESENNDNENEVLTGTEADFTEDEIEELTGDTAELTGEVVELTGNDLELSIARQTLNEIIIQKSEYYNGVTVNVEAQPGNFPEGTELRINPITLKKELNEIKEQIIDSQENISEDSELVAFDISFIYTLSGGNEVEVQPKNGEGVKVTFDYTDNETLSKADNNDEQEVKVFHIDDKDANGEKVEKGEEVVKDVTNKRESEEDGIAVADAETFSVYAVVTTTVNGVKVTYNLRGGYWVEDLSQDPKEITYTLVNGKYTANTTYRTPSKAGYMFMGWFNESLTTRRDGNVTDDMNVYAKWQEFGDLDIYIVKNSSTRTHYTFMDRNMGATELYNKIHCDYDHRADTSCTSLRDYDSYGYYYQWGNNYGFDSYAQNSGALTNERLNGRQNISSYTWENPYTSYKWVVPGANDWMNPINSDLWGGTTDTNEAKQGPCPDGYHIPSSSERDTVNTKWKEGNSRDVLSFFHVDFLLPSTSYRGRADTKVAVGDLFHWRYITSTYGTSITLFGDEYTTGNSPKFKQFKTFGDKGGNGFPVRCIKNVENTGTNAVLSGIDLRGGEKAIISVLSSGEVVSLQEPIRNTNDEFRGWYTTSDYSGNPIEIGSTLQQGDSLYAKWCADGSFDDGSQCINGYTITFDTDGGTNIPSQIVISGETGTRPVVPEKHGYEFSGWYYTGLETEFDFDTPITSNITIYAKWTPIEYIISYELNGGEVAISNPITYTIETQDFTLHNPTRVGYDFMGWSGTNLPGCSVEEHSTCSGTVSIQQGSTGNRVFEAIWDAEKYNLNFDSLGGSEVPTQRIVYGETGTRPVDPAKDGYEFSGWYYTGLETEFDFDTPITSNITIYAKWTLKTYTISYELNGGEIATSNPTTYTKESSEIILNNPSRDWYIFEGWSGTNLPGCSIEDTSTCSGTVIIPHGSTGDRVYEAIWGYVKYDLNFDSLGGSEVPTQRVIHGETGTKPADPTKDGYQFSGWYYTGLETLFNFTGTIINEDITVYAKWNLVNYTIEYNLNGGTGLVNTGVYTIESETFTLNNPTKLNYDFIGWSGTNLSGCSVEDKTTCNTGVTIEYGSTGNRIYDAIFDCAYGRKSDGNCNIARGEDGLIDYENWEYGDLEVDLSITEPVKIVIMDRNLGAATSGIEENAFGFYYQWGNNYGFRNVIEKTSTEQVDASGYGPTNYYVNDTFILQASSGWDAPANYNLWGGTGDTSGKRGNGDDEARQGPCPTGYHVPSRLEWDKLSTFADEWRKSENATDVCSEFNDNRECVLSKFLKLPRAGNINGDGSYQALGATYGKPIGRYWSSSRYDDDYAHRYKINEDWNMYQGQTNIGYFNSNGMSVRCFKNVSSKPIVYELSGGVQASNQTSTVVWWNESNGKTLTIPTKTGFVFEGWYLTSGYEEGTRVTKNVISDYSDDESVTLYAKWKDPEYKTITYNASGGYFSGGLLSTGIVYKEEITSGNYISLTNVQLPNRVGYMFDGWYLTGGKVEWTGYVDNSTEEITVYAKWLGFDDLTVTMGGITFTLMDRNLGATDFSTGYTYGVNNEQNSQSRRGKYYQWGNNYGFSTSGNPSSNVIINNTDNFGPGNYFSNATFIRNGGTNEGIWGNTHNNLWGGQNLSLGDEIRQGPCPINYHIPTKNEWDKAVSLYNVWKDTTEGITYCNSLASLGDKYCFSAKLGLPFPGYMNGANKFQFNDNTVPFYRSSSPSTQTNKPYRFRLDTMATSAAHNGLGVPIRCFKNTERKALSFESKGGEIASAPTETVRWWEDTTSLPTPTRSNSIFSGWYTTSGYEEGTKVELNYIGTGSDSITLYAKWECEDGYIESQNGNSCTKDGYTVTITSNNENYGNVSSGSIFAENGAAVTISGNELKIGETTVTATAKPADAQYTHEFSGWNNSCGASVTTGCEIEAEFRSTVNEYLIRFIDGDGKTIQTGMVAYGEMPAYTGETPRKARTAQYTYTFNGTWDPEITAVTTGAEYTAQFNKTVNEYTVTINANANSGSVSSGKVVADRGSEITINGNELKIGEETVIATAKPADAQYTHEFSGWNNSCGASVTTGCEIEAEFRSTVNEYLIRFYSNGGSPVSAQTKQYGLTVDKPTDPTKNGYSFSGWYSDSELIQKYDFSTTIEGDVDLYAKWTPITYNITYELNGGEVATENPENYTIETDTFTLNNPERVGYDFLGWTGTDFEGLRRTVTIMSGSTGNREYTANWQARNDITLTINHYFQDLDENTNELKTTYTLSGTIISLETADDTIILSNYSGSFDGYIYDYGKVDVDGEPVETTIVLPNGSRVINLYYTRKLYSFTLITDAGSTTAGTTPSGQYYYGAKIILSGDSNSDCFIWTGWIAQGVILENNINQTSFYMPAGNVIVESSVIEKTYNIAFDGNGATSGEMTDLTGIRCTQTVELPVNTFEKVGHTFSGWTRTLGGEKEYNDGQSVSGLTIGNNVTIDLIAIWDINKYTVTWKNSDGTVLKTDTEVEHGTYLEYVGETPTSGGNAQYSYSFSGWTPEIKVITGDTIYTAIYTPIVNEYTITWNIDGTETTEIYKYGEMPSYSGLVHKDANEQYTYSFSGWNPEISSVTTGITYTAVFTPILRTYTIRWINSNGDELELDENVPYGETPHYDGATPTKPGDSQHTYVFTGWLPEIKTVTGDATYQAIYESSVNTYTIIWEDEDGTPLETDYDVPYGAMPHYDGATPTKESDSQYDYVFAGWSPATGKVVGNKIYKATYTPTLRTYTITWKNSDGSILLTGKWDYGTTPAYSGLTPTSGGNAQYTYTFSGWSPEIGSVEGDAEYTAQYSYTVNTYTVLWKNRDGTVLETGENIPYGTIPTHGDILPTRPATAQYTYNFIGWSPEISKVTGDISYVAQFQETLNNYSVKFVDDDGNTLKEIRLYPYGTSWEVIEKPATPTKEQDAQYTYEFAGWTPSVTEITGDITFIATYTPTLRGYRVTWKNRDGTELKTDENVLYGTTPIYSGVIPTKPATSQNAYAFTGWDPEVSEIHHDMVYVAQFEEIPVFYRVTWKNRDGTELEVDENVPYGETPHYGGATPSKSGDIQYSYEFDGWYPALSPVSANITYVAKFKSEVNKYTVTWKNRNGSVLETDENVPYGSAPTYNGATPTKPGNAQYSYEFDKWTPNVDTVEGDMTYTATFREVINKYTVTWENEDGSVLLTGKWDYGTTPAYSGAEPTKTGDAQYSYVFSGWDKEISQVYGDAEYRATYTQSINEYLITFVDGDGKTIQTGMLAYGEAPVYTGTETPTKTATAQYTYTFNNTWSPTIVPVEGEATYTAQFNPTTNKYTITIGANSNSGSVSSETLTIEYGTPITTSGNELKIGKEIITATPNLRTPQYTYEFSGWNNSCGISLQSGCAIEAEFRSIINRYTITWKDGNGNTLKTEEIEYGDTPSYIGSTPTKTATAQYTYTFNNTWSPAIVSVTENATYTAQFDSIVNEYLITFVDGDGKTIQTGMVAYGDTPSYVGATPTKTATAQYTYTFSGWSPTIVPVVKATRYTAQFDSTVNKYTVTWQNEDGAELEKDENVPYGTTPTYNGSTPTKPGDGSGNYIFNGWNPTPITVVGNAVYTAKYKEKAEPQDDNKGNRRSGGGGRKHETSSSEEINQHGSAEDNPSESEKEVFDAYKRAYKYGITTIDTEEAADPDGYVIRGHLAKMVVNFTVNVLGREMPVDTPTKCKRKDKDSGWESNEIKFYAEKSCALGVMGLYTEEFMPNKIVDRAEFGTVVSRLLWGNRYDELDTDNNLFYTKHLKALQESGFMKDIDNPLGRWEIRKRVWLVLKRIETKK